MKRILLSTVLALIATGGLTNGANALPRDTVIYRACMQDVADDFLYGNNSLYGETSVLTAISQAHAYCRQARVN